jgi:hypothetical protein
MRPQGIVRLYAHGRLIWRRQNLFVNSGLPALANLIAGVTAGQSVAAMGFGSGASAPAASDTILGATPAYYNAMGTHSFPSSGSVQFNYSLQATDYGAAGMTIQELGSSRTRLQSHCRGRSARRIRLWNGSVVRAVGAMIVDANGNLQRCTTAGTSGASAPTWATAINATTSDASVVWTLVALHTAPGPLIAHVAVPAFAYTGAGNYAGTWTLTF